jgi:hypothetical protein
MYPALNIPTRATDLTAIERGDKIAVRFTIPPLTTEGLVLKQIGSVELRVGPNPSGGFRVAEWASASKRIDVPVPAQPGPIQTEIAVRDFIDKEVMVAVRVSNANGRMSEWSNIVSVNIEQPLAAPMDFQTEPVPDGVRLKWSAPIEKAFRIFRKAGEEKEPSLLATADQPEYLDSTTEYRKKYEYYVQAFHDKTESDAAGPQVATPKDTFPPRVPPGLNPSGGIGAIDFEAFLSIALPMG